MGTCPPKMKIPKQIFFVKLPKMSHPSKSDIREAIKNFIVKNPPVQKREVVRRFNGIGVPRSTVYHVLKTYEERGHVNNMSQGRKASKMTSATRRLVRGCTGRVGVSQRKLSKKYGIAQSYVCKILKQEGVKYRKRQKGPNPSESQQKTQKTRLRKLTRDVLKAQTTPDIVMDDESYFTFSGSEMPANRGFYAGAGDAVPDAVRIAPQGKFPRKLLVWIAISPRGVTTPVICPSRGNIDGDFYREKCLKQVLLPFLASRYPTGGYIFWPDLATAHYARATVDMLAEAEVPVVARDMNPPNAPQLRPIEDFWGMLKQEVYSGDWTASSDRMLRARIKSCVRQIDASVPRKMMEGLAKRVRLAERLGVENLIH